MKIIDILCDEQPINNEKKNINKSFFSGNRFIHGRELGPVLLTQWSFSISRQNLHMRIIATYTVSVFVGQLSWINISNVIWFITKKKSWTEVLESVGVKIKVYTIMTSPMNSPLPLYPIRGMCLQIRAGVLVLSTRTRSTRVLNFWYSYCTRTREFQSNSTRTCTRTCGKVLRYSYEYWHEC